MEFIMSNPRANIPAQVALVERNHKIQALPSYGSDQSFNRLLKPEVVRVGVGAKIATGDDALGEGGERRADRVSWLVKALSQRLPARWEPPRPSNPSRLKRGRRSKS
jgi:hypothetical protein